MILTTHAIVGAAIATLIPSHPIAALAAGIVSHFAIDAIPHWDYPLRSMFRGTKQRAALELDRGSIIDFGMVAVDGILGLALAVLLFANPANLIAVLCGALGGMLPDPLQFVHWLFPHSPLRILQQFHVWIHSKRKLAWPIGIASQLSFNAIVIFFALVADSRLL
jgi:hypothetical protein